MKRVKVRGGRPLRGRVRVPGDKSIGHRALIFAALAEGRSELTGLSAGLDNRATADAFREMGVTIEWGDEVVVVDGVGLDGLRMPRGAIDCGNSGTTMRLLAGIIAAQRFGTRLVGDASLSRRPMRRIVEPLRARGAHIAGTKGPKEGEHYAPLSIAPLVEGERLGALELASHVASAQVKSSMLLSGLYADGPTAISEPTLSRDHTERMMLALGMPLTTTGPLSVLDPRDWSRRYDGVRWSMPGDLSSAAFLLAAALVAPGSRIGIDGVGVNPTRTGFLDVLRHARVPVGITPRGDAAGLEPIANLVIESSSIAPVRIGGELVTRMIDEVPIFAALATRAQGRTDLRDANELRVKESDRLATMAKVLRAFGGDVVELEDGLTIHGGAPLHAAHVTSEGDHRIAMSAIVLGLAIEETTTVDDCACVDTSYPGFLDTLASLGADVTSEEV